jgi:hypothetical protein
MRTVRLVGVAVAVVLAVSACSDDPASEPPPGWDFFGQVTHVEWTGDYVVTTMEDTSVRLGAMEVTLADGQVLQFPAGGSQFGWCRPVDPEVWSQDYEDCWVAGTMDEPGEFVDSWQTFRPAGLGRFDLPGIDDVVDGEVVIRGIRFPVAENLRTDLTCCEGVETLEDMIGRVTPRLDAASGEIVYVWCSCNL